jgi:tetratricopeptide (TPR) repeat protein
VKHCFQQYLRVAQQFEELNDWETASYFHKRCLDVSVEAKHAEGEAKAYKGLGICEEKVLNIFEAMNHLETALEKTVESGLAKIEREISRELVRVYQVIAIDVQERDEVDRSLEYFEKCLEASKRANDKEKEAECYQRIGLIHEKLGELEKAIACLQRFLEVCQKELKSGSRDKEGEAHKLLADVHAKNGNVQMAIHHLGELMNIAEAENKTQAQADAALKLGLLHY